ncbi:MAG: RrF2 family transcriptional regulator [Anaerolineae bacterium]
MRLSHKGEYGLMALLELATRYGAGPQQAAALAAARGIPAPYLPQILLSLRQAGLVRSTRGPRGGHELGRAPELITLQEAVEALEGIGSSGCAGGESGAGCSRQDQCALLEVWQRADAAMAAVLAQVTLADLVRRERELRAAPMYFI